MNAFSRKTLVVVLVMLTVAVAGWAGRKVYQRATLNRLLSDASRYLDKQDLNQASLCLRQALTINSADVRVNKLMADMLEDAGSPTALNWRIRASQLQTNNVAYRFAWAQTALKVNDLASTVQALRGIDEKYQSTAEFHKLRGALAWNLHLPGEAEKEYTEAARIEPTNQIVALNLATVHLVSTNPAIADNARATLTRVPVNSPVHLTAIRYLTADAMAHKSFDQALRFSLEMAKDPKSTYDDKLTRLAVLQAAKDPGFDAYLGKLQSEAAHAPHHAYLLGHWLQLEKSPSFAFQWLENLPQETKTNLPVPLAISDCQIALKDWNGLQALVQKQDWDEFNYYRLLLEALAGRNTGESIAAKSAWRRSLLMSSSRLDRLAKLDQLTAAWKWSSERTEVLLEIISTFPKEAWASEELSGIYYANGDTHALATLFNKMYATDPANTRLKNNLATVLMLLNSDVQKAQRLALESYSSSTNNPFFACTYAYSLLMQSKPDEAARVVSAVSANYLKNPSIAAYYGVVEAQTGHKDAAKAALKVASSARLLPEELELVRKAEAQL